MHAYLCQQPAFAQPSGTLPDMECDPGEASSARWLVCLCWPRVSGRSLQSARAGIPFPALRNWRIFGPPGTGELRACEVRPGEVRVCEDGPGEVRAGEVRTVEVRAEAGGVEVRVAEDRAEEARAVEIRAV